MCWWQSGQEQAPAPACAGAGAEGAMLGRAAFSPAAAAPLLCTEYRSSTEEETQQDPLLPITGRQY